MAHQASDPASVAGMSPVAEFMAQASGPVGLAAFLKGVVDFLFEEFVVLAARLEIFMGVIAKPTSADVQGE